MIIPSKHVLLVSATERKEVYLFDPKTACVLYTYSSQSGMSSNAAYYQQGQQFIIPHMNNSFVNVWETDTQEPRKFSVGENDKITSLTLIEGNILYMGSSQGLLYIFELPTGILIRKVQLHSHSSQIKRIIHLDQMGYFITCTSKQIKLWPLRELISQTQKPIADRTIHSTIEIIAVQLIRGILCVVTERTLQCYYASNFSLFTLKRDIPSLNNITCCCSSRGSLFLGDGPGKIRQIPIDAHQKQLSFEQRKGKILIENKKGVEIQTKEPITILTYIDSLQFLISGNCKGEVKIWSGETLKNSVQLFKSPICILSVLDRPNKEIKIPQSLKIRSFHKTAMTKIQQPIIVESGILQAQSAQEIDQTQDDYLQRMLNYLGDPSEQLQSEIESIRRQNKQLIEANLQYCRYLGEEKEIKKVGKQYK